MKKVLVLMLVLGMASLANAGLVISVDGVQNPGTVTSATTLAIDSTATIATGALEEGYYGLYADSTKATIDASAVIALSTDPGWSIGGMDGAADFGTAPAGSAGMFAWLFNTGNVVIPVGSVISNIGITVGETPVTVYLQQFSIDPETSAYVGGAVVSSVVITPEPATMAILGLGALLLRRKK